MRCPNCGTEGLLGKRFCAKCGSPLPIRCPKCGAETPADAKFCADCGARLPEAAGPKGSDVTPIAVSDAGERRHLTVLFCDLVGSTEIAAQLDPEEWREVVAGYHLAATEAITRFGGHVAKYLGDGIMAYFGWPVAYGNDAERAARAGLAMIEAIAKLNEQPSRPKLSTRVGIDSGTVVVGAGAGKDAEVFGDVPNIAARVQSAAEPNTVLIAASAHRLISGLFIVENAGARDLKGVPAPIELFRVIRPTGVRGRIRTARGLTAFVGREEELSTLVRRWERTREGEGQMVLVVGEAGIGKSRLVAEFHERIRETPHIWMESAGEQFFENTPFHAVIEMLSRWLELRAAANNKEQFEPLERALSSAGLKPQDVAPLVGELLQLPIGERYPPMTLTPEAKRQRLLAALAGWVFGAARVQPVVMVVEDLHWLDPSTLDVQQLLVEQGATVPLMLLYTARSEFRTPWPLRAHHTQITLNRLSTPNVREMIVQVAARKALADETVDAVVERTSGVPLFVEELTRAVLEGGNERAAGREIPVTLHDSLMARLDRLGSAKEVLQIASVIGGEFNYQLLHAVHSLSDAPLQQELRRLTDADLLQTRGLPPDATYQFKHALIRDAAYEALLKSRRKELHRLIASTIDEKFTDIKESHPEVLARHWTEAGETEHAVAEWTRAGNVAEGRNAFREALYSYHRALTAIARSPESAERDGRELELMKSVVSMLQMTRGYAADETKEAIERAATLAERSNNLSQLVDWINRRWSAAFVSGDLPAADALEAQASQFALREGSAARQGRMHFQRMQIRYMRGDLAGAEKLFMKGLEFFSDQVFRQYPGAAVSAFGWGSWNAWTLGRFDVARERMARMIATAHPNNPYDLAFSGTFAALIHVCAKEYEQAETSAARALELSEKNQFPYLAAVSRCILGQAQAQLGRASDRIALICNGIAGMLAVGSRASLGNFRLADAQKCAGAISEAFDTIEQALQTATEGELVHRPEMLRLRGELWLTQGRTEAAETDFRESIRLARSMGAKAWELRTTVCLARMLVSNSRPEEARSMLTDIYNWFTEGFDTADLKDAKALLDELSA
jgi:class 3 adenylate cyclase/tetratricopeptide (TPR) repeat protein